ncbi:helix-turn-helix domain-containing protein [Escherichia coli]|uniref:Helix-turn-helix domain-containing protein n=1 Tax=Salmonella enterica subsp. enterica serovar Typhi str. CT18 TaxID=220341 RepID=A0A718B9T9_SALTI|nr:helix-turn-helix domain-containing protein [Escherichia coli]HAD6328299.1 helix-turn-helix domain-containing protein [Salmonella enterica subsp. enterica serovar Typhi str. CT18]
MSKYNPNQFYKFDVRISQLSEEINAAARLIYMVMVHSCDFYEEKYKSYSPSIDHLAYMAGVSKRTAIRAIETLEKHGLIQVQKNQGRQSTYRVFTLDDKPELLVRPTSQEVAASVRQNDTTTSDKMTPLPVTKCHGGSDKMSPVLDNSLDKTLNNIKDKSKEAGLNDDIKEEDFLSVNESDLEVSPKKTPKPDKEISDVNEVSDQQDTPCRLESTDDELPDVDLDDEEDPEEELKREQRKAEIKERFRKAKLKNRIDELDDFDDSDDDFTFTPKKKTHTEPKKEKVKVRRVYGGGMR